MGGGEWGVGETGERGIGGEGERGKGRNGCPRPGAGVSRLGSAERVGEGFPSAGRRGA